MPRSNQTTESRTARLTILIDPRKKKIFEEICAAQDLTPSQVVRKLIRQYIIENAAGRPLPEWLTVQGKRSENGQEAAGSRNGDKARVLAASLRQNAEPIGVARSGAIARILGLSSDAAYSARTLASKVSWSRPAPMSTVYRLALA